MFLSPILLTRTCGILLTVAIVQALLSVLFLLQFGLFFIFSMELYFPLTKIEISFDRFFKRTFFSHLISIKCSNSSSIYSRIPLNMSSVPSFESWPISGSFHTFRCLLNILQLVFQIFLILFLELHLKIIWVSNTLFCCYFVFIFILFFWNFFRLLFRLCLTFFST